MKKIFSLTLLALIVSVASFALTPIYGTGGVCTGGTTHMYDTTAGGTWSSSNVSIATIDPLTGILTGLAAGTTTITYTLGTSVTTTVTVTPAPAAISGIGTLCTGSSYTFTDATTGGVWASYASYYATIGSTSGVVAALHPGVATINYSVGTGCSVSTTLTVIATPAVTLMGSSFVCAGSSITLTDSAGVTSGVWSSSDASVATVSGGIVTGVASGTAIISYTTTGICGSVTGTRVISVTATTAPGAITGGSSVMTSLTLSLYDPTSGGVWSSSNPAVATITPYGQVTGIAPGTAVISYAVTGCSGLAYATATITVTAFDGISGDVLFTGASYVGAVKVWLITYNPATLDLEAYDSLYTYSTGTSAHYAFTGVPTDSFRIKAATTDSSIGVSGYVPTYHTSSFYWYAATVLPHVSGTSDINQNIVMSYGITTPGPGFIGGNVSTGANKGTSGTGPAVGLTMYLVDASGTVVQSTKTDASGDYGFSALPLGTYQVFPEALNYITTPYAGITLAAGSSTVTAASFVQHTVSYTITPNIALSNKNQSALSMINVFPNPSNGKLNLTWNIAAAENGTVTIADVTGRQVYSTAVNMNAGSGLRQLDLSSLTSGLYMISVRSESINYNSKVTIAK